MQILNRFVKWVLDNYKLSNGGYRHRGDFFNSDKPVSLQVLKNRFLQAKDNDKQ
jgi:hypothetical protein